MRVPARLLGLALLLVPATPSARAAGQSWVDQPLSAWNSPGADVPTAPPGFGDARCYAAQARWAETPEDQAVVDAGWGLFNPYRAGWGIAVIDATSGYDGMCRPDGFQSFVFVDGVFAGTISPEPMTARATGAGSVVALRDGALTARFLRYADTDPLCCPSRGAVVIEYQVDRTPAGPVLTAASRIEEPPPRDP